MKLGKNVETQTACMVEIVEPTEDGEKTVPTGMPTDVGPKGISSHKAEMALQM